MGPVERLHPLKYRAIWLSDIHLGLRGCQAEFVLDFLHATDCRQLYLVGDIVDLWAMRRGIHWPQSHNNVVRALLDKARNGTQVILIPGNHDELLRTHIGNDFGAVQVRDEVLHTTADGRRLLVLHGDRFDRVVQHGRWLAVLGARLYDLLLSLNHRVNWVRRALGRDYWSLAAYLKHRIKQAVSYIGNFEEALAAEARRRGADGIVCGHIHHAEIRDIGGVTYCNCGDWVESCTALVEHHDGRLGLLRWTEGLQVLADEAPAPLPAAAMARVG